LILVLNCANAGSLSLSPVRPFFGNDRELSSLLFCFAPPPTTEGTGSHSRNQYHAVIVASMTGLDCAHLVIPTGKGDTNSCHQQKCVINLRHAEDGLLNGRTQTHHCHCPQNQCRCHGLCRHIHQYTHCLHDHCAPN